MEGWSEPEARKAHFRLGWDLSLEDRIEVFLEGRISQA